MYRRHTTPPWLIFLITVAFVMGSYYLWVGVKTYLRTGGLGVEEATEQAVVVATTRAAQQANRAIPTATLFPSFTPIPPCQNWVVSVPSAVIRRAPSVESPIIDTFDGGADVCVIERVANTEWYLIDAAPETRRIEEGYMRGDIIRPLNPTPTQTLTVTPPPTVTPITPSPTNTVPPTLTPAPA